MYKLPNQVKYRLSVVFFVHPGNSNCGEILPYTFHGKESCLLLLAAPLLIYIKAEYVKASKMQADM